MFENLFKSKFTKITFEALERRSKKSNVPITDIQLLFRIKVAPELAEKGLTFANITNDEQLVSSFSFMKQFKDIEEVDFKEGILGVHFDIMGYSAIVPDYILNLLLGFAGEHKIHVKDIYIILMMNSESEIKQRDILAYLYNGNNMITQINIDELFAGPEI